MSGHRSSGEERADTPSPLAGEGGDGGNSQGTPPTGILPHKGEEVSNGLLHTLPVLILAPMSSLGQGSGGAEIAAPDT